MSIRPLLPASRSPFPSRARRLAAAAGVIGVIAMLAALVALLITAGRPEPWWSQADATSHTSASAAPAPRREGCDLIAGPARTYCEHDPVSPGPLAPSGQDVARAVWRLIPIASGLAALIVWRRSRAHTRGGC
ncbi:hypothetical protein OG866_00255 [Streptomyces sp. NBC_00663]|uniref:hypothetical protein n=1 Tax=Streptomyces sp. NBC_00663 TaxID=2975801 RepID=UPI002E376FA9|nr:hypothetical protein [Streptomyces sp. NBC_00663]